MTKGIRNEKINIFIFLPSHEGERYLSAVSFGKNCFAVKQSPPGIQRSNFITRSSCSCPLLPEGAVEHLRNFRLSRGNAYLRRYGEQERKRVSGTSILLLFVPSSLELSSEAVLRLTSVVPPVDTFSLSPNIPRVWNEDIARVYGTLRSAFTLKSAPRELPKGRGIIKDMSLRQKQDSLWQETVVSEDEHHRVE